MFWIANILTVFVLSVLLAGIMIPQILLISFRKKLFDEPNERKIHKSAVPRLGGIAFIPVIFICMALMLGLDVEFGKVDVLSDISGGFATIAFCFSALMVIYVVGMADDLVGVKYRAKFVVQIFCAVMLILGGLGINSLHGFLGIGGIPNWISWPLTVLLAVFIINATNLIDGVDGLASGLSSVALITYGIVFWIAGEYIYAMVAAATFGVLVQFFYYNVFGNPLKQKKIFMGDTGSLSIGLMLCILSFKILGLKSPAGHPSVNMLIVAMSPLVIPCFDVVRVYLYRIRIGHNPFLPDKNHIHHKLLALGFSPRLTMMTIVAASVVFTAMNVELSQLLNVNFIILLDVAIWCSAMWIIPRYIRKHAMKIELAENPGNAEDVNYNRLETQNVVDYLKRENREVTVKEILQNVEVDKLRVYAILFRLKQEGMVKVMKQNGWGATESVRYVGPR